MSTVITDEYLESTSSPQPKIVGVSRVSVHSQLILPKTTNPARAFRIAYWICAKSKGIEKTIDFFNPTNS